MIIVNKKLLVSYELTPITIEEYIIITETKA